MLEKAQKTYKSLFSLLKKNKEFINLDISTLEYQAKCHLFGLELKEKYGLNIEPTHIRDLEWIEFGDFVRIGFYDGNKRAISWPEFGKQPQGEYLLKISFSTGAYIFGDDYPTIFFQKFWDELMSYNPDYTDIHNNCIYFSLNNAKDIFNNFSDIYRKYQLLNKEDIKQREILKLEKQLEKLKK